MHLKKKKAFENQLEVVEGNIMQVTTQRIKLDSERSTVTTVAALSSAAKASRPTMENIKLEKVHKVSHLVALNP